jgi:cytosine deaminase
MLPPPFPSAAPDAFRLVNARLFACLSDEPGLVPDQDGLASVSLTVHDGVITALETDGGGAATPAALPAIDLKGGILFPRFVEAHTHLDKGHIWPRKANPDGTFMGALTSVGADREANWTADDVRARMAFGLKSALAHGTGAIRTHIDSVGKQIGISWPVFAEMRAEWADRITLQASPLYGIDNALDPTHMAAVIAAVKAHGSGVLGAVTYMGASLKPGLEVIFRAALDHGWDLDFHVDETNDPAALSLEVIADMALAHRFPGKILCGHCCSLALQSPEAEARVIGKLKEAGVAVVSLPMCNLYLQDRQAGRTPRWRGVTPLKELKAAGVPVMVSSDNTRDPFYAYGDLDALEILREATRILHLDHADLDWAGAVTRAPAEVMRLADAGRLAVGGKADLVITRARSVTELFSRPQSDRAVLIQGKAIDTTLPPYADLDHLM